MRHDDDKGKEQNGDQNNNTASVTLLIRILHSAHVTRWVSRISLPTYIIPHIYLHCTSGGEDEGALHCGQWWSPCCCCYHALLQENGLLVHKALPWYMAYLMSSVDWQPGRHPLIALMWAGGWMRFVGWKSPVTIEKQSKSTGQRRTRAAISTKQWL